MQPTRHALRLLPSRRIAANGLLITSTKLLTPTTAHTSQSITSQKRSIVNSYPRFAGNDDSPRPPGQSPYQVFVETLKNELAKNAEHQENVKQLGGSVTNIPGAQWTKGMYEQMRLTASIKENPKLRAAADEMRKSGMKVSDAIADAVHSFEESSAYKTGKEAFDKASAAVSSATEPIRQTDAYKTVAASVFEALDDVANNSRYGGFVDRDTRRRRRNARLAKLGKSGMATGVPLNPDAGHNVVVHQNATKKGLFSSIMPESVTERIDAMAHTYGTSENLFIQTARGFTSTVSKLFDENETARVIRWAKTLDPDFQTENFLLELREYVVPEVVDAFVSADFNVLREWCSEATFNVLTAAIEPYLKQGLYSDSRVMDIRDVDLKAAKILENDLPVFIIEWRTQEILTFRDPKSQEVIAGNDSRIENCVYVALITRDAEQLTNEVTGGWKIIEMARRSF